MPQIGYSTKLLGVLGENISYTLSPAIHNYVFERLSIDAVYLAFDLKREKFRETIRGLLNLAYGLNVTIPYKEDVIPYLSGLSEEARRVGAVNTVKEGFGHNTDYLAVKQLVSAAVEGPRVCAVFGAGGAGKAVAVALADLGCEVLIINRTRERALELATRIVELGCRAKVSESCPEDQDVVVNATPNPDIVPDHCVKGRLALDMVYKPLRTSLTVRAERKGMRVINGLQVLVRQALEADRIWFGKSLSDEEVLEYLSARQLVR
jgi:shikimate dehydrogenase